MRPDRRTLRIRRCGGPEPMGQLWQGSGSARAYAQIDLIRSSKAPIPGKVLGGAANCSGEIGRPSPRKLARNWVLGAARAALS
jgi:hypothetical protein